MRGQFTAFSILLVETLLFYVVLAKSYYEVRECDFLFYQ